MKRRRGAPHPKPKGMAPPFAPGSIRIGRRVYRVIRCRWSASRGRWEVVIERPARWRRLGLSKQQVVEASALQTVRVQIVTRTGEQKCTL